MTDRGLVISASGIRLVYEIGVLRGLADHADPSRTLWKHVYGSSGGALLATFLAQYPVGEERRAIMDMEKLVLEFLGESGARSYFPFGLVQGLIWNKSLYDPSMLYNVVEQHIKPERIRDSGRKLNVVVADYSNPTEKREYTEKDWKIIKDAVCASCSVPLGYPPKEIPDECSSTGKIFAGDGGICSFFPLERAAQNPLISNIDAILSVGSKEARVVNLAQKGKYPDLTQIANAMMEGWYGSTIDMADSIISNINMRVKNKAILRAYEGFFDDVPRTERERIIKECNETVRNSYVECTIFRPVAPLSVSASGISDSVTKKLWDVGFSTAVVTMEKETGTKIFQRQFYV